MGSELTFWAFHKDPPKEVERKDQEFLKNKRIRNNSLCSQTTASESNEAASESQDYKPEKIGKRRFSLDLLFSRRGSKGKVKINGDKRGSSSSTDSTSYPANNQRRRSSTRMEGNSELAAWCFI